MASVVSYWHVPCPQTLAGMNNRLLNLWMTMASAKGFINPSYYKGDQRPHTHVIPIMVCFDEEQKSQVKTAYHRELCLQNLNHSNL